MDSPTPTTPALPECTTAIPDNNGYVPPTACNANYGFYPSFEWNLVFAVLFGLTTLVHLGQMFKYRKWFCWVVVMGSLWELMCFALRTVGARDQQNAGYVIASMLLFLLAPLWINAFVYMIVARLVYYLLPQERILGMSPRWLAKIFVAADIVSFLVQAVGGAMLANTEGGEVVITGQRIYMGGIGVQLFFVTVFGVVTVVFFRRVQQRIRSGTLARDTAWVQPLIWVLISVILLIVVLPRQVRVIFRLVEFGGGASESNPILTNEAYPLGLDAFPMFVALLILNIVHPGLVLKGPESSFPRGWKRRTGEKSQLLEQGSDVEMGDRNNA
ncbi:RTA1 like protein-domain-containing protein [Cercophora newfieldiana]|uniref:RTA1 like protein-domain-containing protein n=1 Tax=Cercophora newfieldiana TaxID=92897 RepID=A0AA39Y9L5_9PEZI|nr:RTA1 like protein-domain-containing protein [Cercophora newfieldiana]